MAFLVRKARGGDEHRIAEICIGAWQSAYAGIMAEEYLNSLSVEESSTQWHRTIREPGLGSYIVVETSGVVEGFAVFGPARDSKLKGEGASELVAINISPNQWRSGLGWELMNYIERDLSSRGFKCIYLWVATENRRARAFYSAYGFVRENITRVNQRFSNIEETRYCFQLVRRAL